MRPASPSTAGSMATTDTLAGTAITSPLGPRVDDDHHPFVARHGVGVVAAG